MRKSCQEVSHRHSLNYCQWVNGVSSPPWLTSGCHSDSAAKMCLQQRSLRCGNVLPFLPCGRIGFCPLSRSQEFDGVVVLAVVAARVGAAAIPRAATPLAVVVGRSLRTMFVVGRPIARRTTGVVGVVRLLPFRRRRFLVRRVLGTLGPRVLRRAIRPAVQHARRSATLALRPTR